jgi:CHAD domain-containing protein
MDVLTGYASSIHLKGEEECGVKLLEYIVSKRRKQARKLHADLKRFRPGLRKDLKRAASVLEKLFRNTGRNGAPGIDAVAANAALKIAAQLAAPRRLNRGNLHEYRLKVKELQDVLLVANGSSRPALVDDLGEVKDAIGEWHDWEELVSIAQKVLAHKNRCALQAELKRIAKDKYAQALALVGALRQRDLGEARASAKGASAVRRIRRKPAAV